MPVTKKTYTPLIELPDVLIGRCSQVLPNRLQCWKAGDYQVEEELPPPATPPPADSGKGSTTPSTPTPQKEGVLKSLEHKVEDALSHKKAEPTLKQQQGEPLGQPGSGTTSQQPEQQKESAEPKAAPPTTRKYQLCAMHATIQQRADTLASQEEASGKTTPDDSDPKSIHSRMLQVEQKARTSNMQSGESMARG